MDSVVNMRYFKQIANGNILSFGEGGAGIEITKEEHDAILNALANKPIPTETTDYQLKEDLVWEAYTIEPIEEGEEQ